MIYHRLKSPVREDGRFFVLSKILLTFATPMQHQLTTPEEVREYLDEVLKVRDLENYAHMLRDKLLEKLAHLSLAIAGDVGQKDICQELYGYRRPKPEDIVLATQHLKWVIIYVDSIGRWMDSCVEVELKEPSLDKEAFVKRWQNMFHPIRLLSLRKYVSKNLPLAEDKNYEDLLKRYNIFT